MDDEIENGDRSCKEIARLQSFKSLGGGELEVSNKIAILPTDLSTLLSDPRTCILEVRSVGNIKISIQRNISVNPECRLQQRN
jgi:hypothetical protein